MVEDTVNQGMQRRLLGRWGEELAAREMRKKGWTILAAGFHCRFGEIDIIAENGKFLSFTEVKLRKNADFGTAGESVDARKQHRIRRTAEIFLSRHPSALQPRFDVVEIYAPQGMETKKPEIHYIENAF